MELPALGLAQNEGASTVKPPSTPAPRALPGPCPAPPHAGRGPSCPGSVAAQGGRGGGGRSRCKMAAQRRSLLQSVSGIFPPFHAHAPPGGCEALRGAPPHPPRSAAVWERGRSGLVLSLPPCAASGQGGPGLRGGRVWAAIRSRGCPAALQGTVGDRWLLGTVPGLRAPGCPAG